MGLRAHHHLEFSAFCLAPGLAALAATLLQIRSVLRRLGQFFDQGTSVAS